MILFTENYILDLVMVLSPKCNLWMIMGISPVRLSQIEFSSVPSTQAKPRQTDRILDSFGYKSMAENCNRMAFLANTEVDKGEECWTAYNHISETWHH